MPNLDFLNVTNVRSPKAFSVVSVLKSLAIAYGFTFIVLAVFALLITYTSMPDSIIGTVVFITMVFAVMVAGFMVARNASSRGWLNGAVGGLIYVLILYILGAVFVTDLVFDKHVVSLVIVGFLAGAFGGIVGINTKKK